MDDAIAMFYYFVYKSGALFWKNYIEFRSCFLQVHNIYKDPSIGNAVNIVVVKVLVLESERVSSFSFFCPSFIHSRSPTSRTSAQLIFAPLTP